MEDKVSEPITIGPSLKVMSAKIRKQRLTESYMLNAKALKIQDGQLGFFIAPFEGSYSFKSMQVKPGKKVWDLRFFENSPFEQCFAVEIEELEFKQGPRGAPINPESGALEFNNDQRFNVLSVKSPPTEQTKRQLRRILKAPVSVTDSDWQAIADGSEMLATRFNLAMVGNESKFERSILLQTLAVSYFSVLRQIMIDCKAALQSDNPGYITALERTALLFLAEHFYSFPVERYAPVVSEIWEAVSKQLRLDDLENECVDQLERLSRLTQVRAKSIETAHFAKQARHQETISKRVTFLGAMFAVLTLVTVLPTDIGQFFQSWAGWVVSIPDTVMDSAIVKTVLAPSDP